MTSSLIYLNEKRIWEDVSKLTIPELLDLIDELVNDATMNLEPYIWVQELRKRLKLNYKFPLNDPEEFGYEKEDVVKI